MVLVWRICCVFLLSSLVWTGVAQSEPSDDQFTVLVVASYRQISTWDTEIRAEIEKNLGRSCKIHFYYLHALSEPESLQQRAAEAFKLYRQLQPDGVIAVDDPAQSAFVVPYLKNRVSTPVVFCGVNASLQMYGYPAKNVTGVKSQLFLEEGFALSQQLAGPMQNFAVLMGDNPMSDLFYAQIVREHPDLAKKMVAFRTAKSLSSVVSIAEELRDQTDLLLILPFSGVLDDEGKPVKSGVAIEQVVEAFNKPTFSIFSYFVKTGALSGVLNSGREEAKLAADMLLSIMRGVPFAQLKVTHNHSGVRMINVTTLRKLSIVPDPMVLRGAELVRSQ